mgnify:CR=1 FL=1
MNKCPRCGREFGTLAQILGASVDEVAHVHRQAHKQDDLATFFEAARALRESSSKVAKIADDATGFILSAHLLLPSDPVQVATDAALLEAAQVRSCYDQALDRLLGIENLQQPNDIKPPEVP